MPAVAWEQVPPPTNPSLGTVSIQGVTKKVAVCIPHSGEVSAEWCLQMMNLALPPGCQPFMSRGLPLDVTREQMARDAVRAGFEYVFFLDSDVLLPPRAIEVLLSANLPIVAGLYRAKKAPIYNWSAWMRVKDEATKKEGFLPIEKWTGRHFYVDVTGCGCMMIHRSVFEKMSKDFPRLPWFFWGLLRNEGLLDTMMVPDNMMREVSEDFWFCLLAKKCGFQVAIDGEMICYHISVSKITKEGVMTPGV